LETDDMTPSNWVTDGLATIADGFGVTMADVTSSGRTRTVTSARRACARWLHLLGFSQNEIGRMLGGRDHSTILALIRCECGARTVAPSAPCACGLVWSHAIPPALLSKVLRRHQPEPAA
jgi:Bacterial dnaA protein helix-turn-helix